VQQCCSGTDIVWADHTPQSPENRDFGNMAQSLQYSFYAGSIHSYQQSGHKNPVALPELHP